MVISKCHITITYLLFADILDITIMFKRLLFSLRTSVPVASLRSHPREKAAPRRHHGLSLGQGVHREHGGLLGLFELERRVRQLSLNVLIAVWRWNLGPRDQEAISLRKPLLQVFGVDPVDVFRHEL